jgi:selenocysteine lyase/cysteine desulfurase
MIFDKRLYDCHFAPDQPGGGTVKWTNPWGEYSFYEDVESREDGGTPPFLQTIKTALCIKLKQQMSSDIMLKREEALRGYIFKRLNAIENLHVLAGNIEERLLLFSFHIENLHYNLGVRLLSDRFGIQARGGCSCAGTYGHYLLHVSPAMSKVITDKIEQHDLSEKPGWIRISLHPVMKDSEIEYILDALEELANTTKHG